MPLYLCAGQSKLLVTDDGKLTADPDCCRNCDICTQDDVVSVLTAAVTIAGVSGPGVGCLAGCDDCDRLNSTFIMELLLDTDPVLDADPNCYARIVFYDDDPCGFGPPRPQFPISVSISEPDDDGEITISVVVNTISFEARASYTVAIPIDCANFGPVTMTIDSVLDKHVDCCDTSGISIQLSLSIDV